jgi:hypothetical protein
VEKYVENKEANRQGKKVNELVARGYSDKEIAKRFEIDGEDNLAASSNIWVSSDIEKIRLDFSQRIGSYSPVLFVVIFIIVLFVGGLVGLFFAFVCNGGAAGSSQMSASAWGCLLPYLIIYFLVLASLIAAGRREK